MERQIATLTGKVLGVREGSKDGKDWRMVEILQSHPKAGNCIVVVSLKNGHKAEVGKEMTLEVVQQAYGKEDRAGNVREVRISNTAW